MEARERVGKSLTNEDEGRRQAYIGSGVRGT